MHVSLIVTATGLIAESGVDSSFSTASPVDLGILDNTPRLWRFKKRHVGVETRMKRYTRLLGNGGGRSRMEEGGVRMAKRCRKSKKYSQLLLTTSQFLSCHYVKKSPTILLVTAEMGEALKGRKSHRHTHTPSYLYIYRVHVCYQWFETSLILSGGMSQFCQQLLWNIPI